MAPNYNMSGSKIPIGHPASSFVQPYYHVEIIDGERTMVPITDAYLAAQEPVFPCFSLIPVELKVKIWKEAMHPQFVTILSNDRKAGTDKDGNRINHQYRVKAYYKLPAILHVCQQSRAEALKVYRPAFGDYTGGNPIFFDFARDELLIKDTAALYSWFGVIKSQSTSPDIQNFKSLRSLSVGKIADAYWLSQLMRDCWHLKRVTIQAPESFYGIYYPIEMMPQLRVELSNIIKQAWTKAQKEEIEVAAVNEHRVVGALEAELSPLPTLEIIYDYNGDTEDEKNTLNSQKRKLDAEYGTVSAKKVKDITVQTWLNDERVAAQFSTTDMSNIDPALLKHGSFG